jgi:hypothetical protein
MFKRNREMAPPPKGDISEFSTAEKDWNAQADTEAMERKKHREEVKKRVIEKYLKDRPEESMDLTSVLDNILDEEDLTYEDLDNAGIRITKNNSVRIGHPERGNTGMFASSEAVKAFLVGMKHAETDIQKWEVVADIYDYLGLEAPPKPREDEPFIPPTLPFGIFRKMKESLLALAILAGLSQLSGHKGEAYGNSPKMPETPTNTIPGEGLSVELPPEIKIPETTTYRLQKGETLGTVVKKFLTEGGITNPNKEQIFELIKILANSNDVSVPELGVKGKHDDEKLPIGFEVGGISIVKQKINELRSSQQ